MTAEHAAIVRDVLVAGFKAEHGTTKRVIAAVPADKGDYTPDEKSMTAMKLAWHIASSEVWFLNSIADGKFDFTGEDTPPEVKTPAEVAAWYEAEFGKALARIEALSGEHLATSAQFAVWTNPLIDTLGLALRHSVHHRGQLSAYLRPMGAKVPSIYGPSGDVSVEELTKQAGTAAA
jgi:uncharacterized damage-inducible protein DinB